MTAAVSDGEVVLADDRSALQILHEILQATIGEFPELGAAGLAVDFAGFRQGYPDQLPQLEARRLASTQRTQIADFVLDRLGTYLRWRAGGAELMLREALSDVAHHSVSPLPLQEHRFSDGAGWSPSFVYRGERYDSQSLASLGQILAARHIVSQPAAAALSWLQREQLQGQRLNLAGRKIAMLGAAAEMAPTRHWLEAGADVLWIDRVPPPQEWLESSDFSGRLVWPADNADLLRQPREILATLVEFAQGEPLDLGLYAYAPGQAREMRLTAVMNAIADALPDDLIRSITVLVSPTTPAALFETDLREMAQREDHRPKWMSVCARLGLLGRGAGFTRHAGASAARTVVAIQGGSYQAAQYLGKILTAEVWAQRGLRVSANTAAITRTRSLSHPVFAAAFGGAAAFGVETMTPRQSRCLNGLLCVHDWLHPQSPIPGTIRVHGGIHTLPYPLGSALRVAAAIGFARDPRLLKGLLRR